MCLPFTKIILKHHLEVGFTEIISQRENQLRRERCKQKYMQMYILRKIMESDLLAESRLHSLIRAFTYRSIDRWTDGTIDPSTDRLLRTLDYSETRPN